MTVVQERRDLLVDLVALAERGAELRRMLARIPSWPLTPRQECDLELLACGAFSPLTGFLDRADYESVCTHMRLADGTLWPIPVVLDVDATTVRAVARSHALALRDAEGECLAVLHVSDAWQPDRRAEAEAVLGTLDPRHPGVEHLLDRGQPWYLTGRLEVLRPPVHRDFADLRRTPRELHAEYAERGWSRIVAFQTRNPMHRAHQQLTLRAARRADAKLLVHPVVGIGRPGDVDPAVRVRCYRALLPSYPRDSATLALLPLAMRMAGPREAMWHALIRRNYGATHFIVGRDHAGPGLDSHGNPFYRPYAAQQLLHEHAGEIGIEIVPFERLVYVPARDEYCPEDQVPGGVETRTLSGTELRNRLATGDELPAWFTPPPVAAVLKRAFPPLTERGFTVLFTGLSGAGKSTIAEALAVVLRERFVREVTLLDGDVVRRHLSAGLGFSAADRDTNVLRIGFVAAEITRHRGVAVCAPIAPYDAARREVRRMVQATGGFVLVHVATPLSECERRDRKGLYARARAGLLPHFTGISDRYDEPDDADVVIDTLCTEPGDAVERILAHLQSRHYLPPVAAAGPARGGQS